MAKADDTTNFDEAALEAQAAEAVAEKTEATADSNESERVAKAGKRSAKSLKEAEEQQAKEERKLENAEEADKPKQHANPTRSRLDRQGKKFRDAAKLIEKDKVYTLKEAIELAQKTSPVKFDASVELHVNLGVDPRHADQNIRTNLVLPAGTGRTVKVAVFDDVAVEGADLQGVEEITKQLEKGEMNFDILIATPANMAKLGKFARALGPRGLMPNPKSGTVTTDTAKAVREAKAGRVEFRVDSTGIVHLAVGKVSFGTDKLTQNIQAVLTSLRAAKPASVKGIYVKAIHLSTAMGPSIKVAVSEL